jgi:hypothetical protein
LAVDYDGNTVLNKEGDVKYILEQIIKNTDHRPSSGASYIGLFYLLSWFPPHWPVFTFLGMW